MNVPVANVIVAFDAESMNTAFALGGGTFSTFLEKADKDPNLLFFNTKNNPNFISLSHGLGKEEGQNVIELELIDPNDEFEKRFITDNSVHARANDIIQSNTPRKQNPISKLRLENTTKQFKEKAIDQYVTEYTTLYQNAFGIRTLYIAYGIGEDLNFWSGPHQVTLAGATINLKEGKKIKLKFVAHPNSLNVHKRRGVYNEKVNINLEGLDVLLTARSKYFNFNEILGKNTTEDSKGGNVPIYAAEELAQLSNSTESFFLEQNKNLKLVGAGSIISLLEEVDFHLLITDVLRDLISKATNNPNVIVLLPNINYICRQLFLKSNDNLLRFQKGDNFALNQKFVSMDRVMSNLAGLNNESLIVVGQLITYILSILEEFGLDLAIEEKNSKLAKLIPHAHLAHFLESTELKNSSATLEDALAAALYDIENEISIYALEQNELDGGQRLEYWFNLETERRQEEIDTITKNVTAKFKAEQAKPAPIDKDYKDRATKFLALKKFFATKEIKGKSQLPDYQKAVDEIIGSINEASNYGIQAVTLYETNTKLKQYWEKEDPLRKNFPLFGGFGNTFDPNFNPIIFGDIGLIKKFLYGELSSESLDTFNSNLSNQTGQTLAQAVNQPGPLLTPAISSTIPFVKSVQAGINFIPLHPLDKAVLVNKPYNKEVREITRVNYSTLGQTSLPFGSPYKVPDEFSYVDKEAAAAAQKEVVRLDIPVFKFNTTNPNITDLTCKFGDIYFSQLSLGWSKEVSKRASATLAGVLSDKYSHFEFEDKIVALGYIAAREQALGADPKAREQIQKELSVLLHVPPYSQNGAEEEAKDAYAAYLALEKNDQRAFIQIKQKMPGDPIIQSAYFKDNMFKSALQVHITTLPMFHLSSFSKVLGQQCVVFAQEPKIIQTHYNKKGKFDSFVSGEYSIVGFKHTISGSDISSKFNLIKHSPTQARSTPNETNVLDLSQLNN